MLRGEHGVTIADDIEACELVRDQAGSDYRLMLDSAWAYSYPEAVSVGKAIEDLGFYWYEDPLPADDIHGYRRSEATAVDPDHGHRDDRGRVVRAGRMAHE